MTNPYQAPSDGLQEQPPLDDVYDGVKVRHGCVTAWLILMIVANSATIFTTLAMSAEIKAALPDMPDWGGPVLVVCGAINLVCAILLFMWKKIGFFGFIITSLIAAGVNISAGLGAGQIVAGLIGVVILYGILQIGSPTSTWKQLE